MCVCTFIQIHRHNLSRIVAHLAKPLTHGRPHPIKNLTLQSITRFCPRLSHITHTVAMVLPLIRLWIYPHRCYWL